MSATNTKISWTDATWNPVRGCSRVSPGCENCYAERQANRFKGKGQPYEGLVRLSKKGPVWTGKVRLVADQLDVPLRWRKPKRIFVNSMSDLFHEKLTNEEIAAVFGVMAACPQHTFQILTKRAKRMREWFGWLEDIEYGPGFLEPHGPDPGWVVKTEAVNFGADWSKIDTLAGAKWPLPNVHLGVSVENQQYADERIPDLLRTAAAVRWISYEPALGPINFGKWITRHSDGRPMCCSCCNKFPQDGPCDHFYRPECPDCRGSGLAPSVLDWIVCGGESGPNSRLFDVGWARSVIKQCKSAGVKCFVKQLGARPFQTGVGLLDDDDPDAIDVCPIRLKDRKGGDWSEWSEDLRVREWPR